MGCSNEKITNLCGEKTFASCTEYEGTVSNNSSLDPVNDCLSLEETTQDIYNQLDEIISSIGQAGEGTGSVNSVNDVEPDLSGNIEIDSDDVPEGDTNLYATPAEKAIWNAKQNALGYVPVPETRTVNGFPLTTNITINKSDVGLGNVPNINATVAANITQTSTHRFVTDVEKAFWNSLGAEPDLAIDVTYSELSDLIDGNLLKEGAVYLLTDYMTTYTQPVTSVSKSSGILEPLYITAIGTNLLHNICKSKLYPQDIVYYSINPDIGDGALDEGFTKGKIYRRIDTIKNNDITTDWRHVKYDRLGTDYLLFESYVDVMNNKISSYGLSNTVIGDDCFENVLLDIYDTTIGSGFYTNKIDYCINTTIGNDCKNNSGISLEGCTILDDFVYNIFNNKTESLDLTSATELYNKAHPITIVRLPNSTYQYTYIDNFGDIIIEEIT